MHIHMPVLVVTNMSHICHYKYVTTNTMLAGRVGGRTKTRHGSQICVRRLQEIRDDR